MTLKKLVVAAAAAAVVSVPLAGLAGANPGDPQNGGGQGKGPIPSIPGPPGNTTSQYAQVPGLSTAATFNGITAGQDKNPGQYLKNSR